jgi:hypothetical protein
MADMAAGHLLFQLNDGFARCAYLWDMGLQPPVSC